jgi:hypothetical protein
MLTYTSAMEENMLRACCISISVVGLFFSACPTVAQEDACAPEKFLTRDTYNFDEHLQTELTIFQSKEIDSRKNNKTSLGFTYSGIGFDADQASSAVSRLKSLLDVSYSDEQKRSLFVSTLSPIGLEAYNSCLVNRKKEDISHSYSANVLESKQFFLTINWHPLARPEPDNTEANLSIIGGKFLESGNSKLLKTAIDRKSFFVEIERDIFTSSHIEIEIKGKTHSIDLPAKSRFEIYYEELNSNPNNEITKSGQVTTSQTTGLRLGGTICALIPNADRSAVMVVGKKFPIYSRKLLTKVEFTEEWVSETPKGACFNAGCFFRTAIGSTCNIRYDVQIGIWRAVNISNSP